jgi:hypothetical protein
MSFSLLWMPDSAPVSRARENHPELMEVAELLPTDPALQDCAQEGSFTEAIDVLWNRLT